MVPHFSEHASNERTFLSWTRTAIAIMAFGFLVEKLDLFGHRGAALPDPFVAEAAGFGLMAFGLVIVAVAATRFLKNRKKIDDATQHGAPGAAFDLALVAMMLLVGCAFLLYLAYSVQRHFVTP
jgi:putative membrane protein